MTTAIIGTGGIGSAIARLLASGGETLRLSSADKESARTLATEVGRGAVVAVDNRDALQGADAVVLALRFGVLKSVIDEIADLLTDKLVVVPSNPLSTDAQGNVSHSCRRSNPLARLSPGGCRQGRAWPWRLEPCRPISWSPPAIGRQSRRFSSTRRTTTSAGEEVERLIRTAGFEPMKVGGITRRVDSRWAATFMTSSSAPPRRGHWSVWPDHHVAGTAGATSVGRPGRRRILRKGSGGSPASHP